MTMDDLVARILSRRQLVSKSRTLLVGISGIDGSGKGYVTQQIVARLAQHLVATACINVDGWLNLPQERFDPKSPAENFYRQAIRFDDLFTKLVLPLRDQRSVNLVADFLEETAQNYRSHVYSFKNIEIVLVEGIFLFKREYRELFDLRIWVDCSFSTALARALKRNQESLSPAAAIRAYDTIYFPAQRIHAEIDNPRETADLIFDNDPYFTGCFQQTTASSFSAGSKWLEAHAFRCKFFSNSATNTVSEAKAALIGPQKANFISQENSYVITQTFGSSCPSCGRRRCLVRLPTGTAIHQSNS